MQQNRFIPVVCCKFLTKPSQYSEYACTVFHSKYHLIQTKLLLANPYANIEGQRIVVIPQQCKQKRTL